MTLKTTFLALFSMVLTLICCTVEAQTVDYRIHRKERNIEFKDPEESPLSPNQIKTFRKLPFFRARKGYRIAASFIRASDSAVFEMPTSTSRKPKYRKYAYVEFEIGGESRRLAVYQNMALVSKEGYADYLFLPFTDLTSGGKSYGGGRYLDLRVPKDGKLVLDFNLCYNPYCAYNDNYSCPIPPKENFISIAVKAGEKSFPHPDDH